MSDVIAALESRLAAATEAQQKIDLMNELAWALKDVDPQRGLALSELSYEQATIGIPEAAPYQIGQAYSLRNLGRLHLRLGNYDRALSYSFQALSIFATLDYLKEQANVLGAIGSVYWRLADYGEALAYQLQALRICQENGDKEGEADTLNNLGIVYGESGDHQQELAAYFKALQLQQEIGNQRGQAIALNNISESYRAVGDYTNALTYGYTGLELAWEIGDKVGEAYSLDGIGAIYLDMNDYSQALAHFQQSLLLCREMGDRRGEMTVLLNLGKVFQQQQKIDEALAYFQQALTLAQETEAKAQQFQCHLALTEVYKKLGLYKKALAHYEQFHALKEMVFNVAADNKLKNLQVVHDTETARKEAEIYQLKNVALEQEIHERERVETALRQAKDELEAANQQMQEELGLAREIQYSLLPSPRPYWPDLDVICYTSPARQVGGDFYSYREIDSKDDEPNRYALAIGDVSGKGVSAALLMTVSLSQFDTSFTHPLQPGERLAHLDIAILPYTKPRRQNCALCYVEVTPPVFSQEIEGMDETTKMSRTGVLRVANAAGIPPYLKRMDGSVEVIEVGGFALGQGLGVQLGYQEYDIELSRGDLVILTSDGVVEANNSSNRIFGFERLEAAIRSGPISNAPGMLDHLMAEIAAFVGEAEAHDDLTIIIVQV